MMIIGTDSAGKVLLVSDGDASHIPTEFNGVKITIYALTPEQAAAYKQLTFDRAGAVFDGFSFTAIERPHAEKVVGQIAQAETAQPVTQRALREMILVIGQAFPAAQQSVFYQKAAAQEIAVAALRSEL